MELSIADGIATITLNQPSTLNALNPDGEELQKAVRLLQVDFANIARLQ
jgi:enoyl-CoA hydratase/carnithine racemase